MKYLYILAALAAAALVGTTTQMAFAEPAFQSGFGQAAETIATEGDMGCHSSSFDEPRAGIGNVAAGAGLTVWELGYFLLTLLGGGVPGC